MERYRHFAVGGFFASVFFIGLLVYKDFGVGYDEPFYYEYGRLVFDYLGGGSREFERFFNFRFYGPVVGVAHALVGQLVSPSPESAIPLAHLVNYLIFLGGSVAFYRLCSLQFESWRWALLGTAMLFLSPRIFSHAFVNPKDGPFMAMFMVNMYLLVLYLQKRRVGLLALLGFASGLLIDIRVVGFVVPALLITFLAADLWGAAERPPWRSVAGHLGLYFLIMLSTVYAFWPFLWKDPIGRLGQTFALMSHFVEGPLVTVFMGDIVSTADLPWYYLPVWIGVTTPIIYLALGMIGLASQCIRDPFVVFRARSKQRFFFLYAAWLFTIPVFVILAGSHLYDEWRQVNFVYPAMVLFVVGGAKWVWVQCQKIPGRGMWLAKGWIVILLIAVAFVGVKTVSLHPYEAIYFNSLAGGGDRAERDFELDYWGLSYKEGISYLLSHFSGRLKVYGCTPPAEYNSVLFDDRERLEFVSLDDADFGLCAPRDYGLASRGRKVYLSEYPTLHTVSRDGAAFLYVKDLR